MKISVKLCLTLWFGSTFILGCTSDQKEATKQAENAIEKDSAILSTEKQTPLNFQLNSIEDIRNTYQLVRNNCLTGKLDSVSFHYDCNGERKGEVTYFRHNEHLVLIVHQYNEYDHFSAKTEYYLYQEKPYFIFSANTTWAFQDGGGTKDKVIEKRTYITAGEEVKCLERINTVITDVQGEKSETEGKDKVINCESSESRLADFRILLKYRDKGTSGCLKN